MQRETCVPLSLAFSALAESLLSDFSEELAAPLLFEEEFIINYNVILKFSWSSFFSNSVFTLNL